MNKQNPRLTGGFGIVSRSVMADAELSTRDKAIYAYLTTYADSVTNELYVSVNRIAAECGITQSTVKRSLKLLEEKQIIIRLKRGSRVTRKTVLLK
jgi:DeoR/GlpR family transcriptional regulator of sugar metabolism